MNPFVVEWPTLRTAWAELKITPQLSGAKAMSKEQKSNKETKKKALLTPKEKKAAKKSRKASNSQFGH
jgi:hypothetical protein